LKICNSGRINSAYWGWMSSHGPGTLVPINVKLTGELYTDILENHILPLVYANDGRLSFVHDNSAVHTSRVVRKWFDEHPEINVINWPARSPDLNPIENLWSQMMRLWNGEENAVLRNSNQLGQHIQNLWQQLNGNYCHQLVDSMPGRLEEVIQAGGYYTKY